MQRVRRAIRDLVVLIVIASALRLLGCSDSVQQANINDVDNQSFTFASGAVFNQALANVSTALAFSNNAINFTLSSLVGVQWGSTPSAGIADGHHQFLCLLVPDHK